MVGRGDPGVGPGETSGGLAASAVGEQEVTARLPPWPCPPSGLAQAQEAHASGRPVVSGKWTCSCFSRVLGESDQRGGGNGGFQRSAQLQAVSLQLPPHLHRSALLDYSSSSHHRGCRVNLLLF